MLLQGDKPETTRAEFDSGWYALYTRHHHEKNIARTLSTKGFSVFLPLYAAPRKWKDRTKVIMLPLFSCYVFLQGGLERHVDVVTTAGVYGFVCCGERPARISQAEIQGIRQVVERSIKIEPHPFISREDRVRVKSGPLEGIEGILIRKKNFSRLVLTVEFLWKSAAVEVDVSIVERIGRPDIAHSSAERKTQHFALAHAE